MSSKRPLFNKSISELEKLVGEMRHDGMTLARVSAELNHRDTDRSARLRNRVTAIQQGLELRLTQNSPEPEVPFPAPADQPSPPSTDMKATLPNRPEQASERSPESLSVRQGPGPASEPVDILPADTSDHLAAVEAAPPIVVSRMLDLIDYVISVEKDKLKIVTDVNDHRAFNRTFDKLAPLPGVHLNSVEGDEVAWLKVERLAKLAPPAPVDEVLKAWTVLFDDPRMEPQLRETLSAIECQQAGIELEPGQPSATLDLLPDEDDIKAAFADYVAGTWTEWAEREVPRRETMALYGSLFALQAVLSAPDGTPQEFVCGIGYAALLRGGKRLCYPLLTVPLDIELDHKSHVISVMPREEVAPSVETDPLDVLELKQVDRWRQDARRVLDGLEDSPLSPFAPETYDTILRQAAALLDPQARYLNGDGTEILAPPVPESELVICNAFGFFQRERRATQLMADLIAFRGLLEEADGQIEIPGAIATLFTEPSSEIADENFPTFRGINSIPGVTSSDGGGDDLFFPKPFNGEQVQIVQRLAVRDGVVVQGPPGTGKTHTIANIISHYLATGKRVLVTSQKSPALQVLQGQLPAAIRPLSVSLLDSDREGLRQFRASVDLIAERLQSLRRSEIESEIAGLESRIDGLHRQLALIDNEVDRLGREALEPVRMDDQVVPPLEAALEVLQAGEEALWLEDAITPQPIHDPAFTNDDIAAMRQARAILGPWLAYLGKQVPPADLLTDVEGIVGAHTDLVAAAALKREISSGAIWALTNETPESIEAASVLNERLTAWTLQRDGLDVSPPVWDRAIEELLATPSDPLLQAIQSLTDDARVLAEDHAWFLIRPVEIPEGALDDPRFLAAVEDLQQGGQGLGAIAGLFARKTKQLLGAVRLKGKTPSGSEDWQTVARFAASTALAMSFTNSWNHARAGTELPTIIIPGPAAGREAVRVIDRIEALLELRNQAASLTKELRRLLPQWPGIIDRQQDTSPILNCLRIHLDRARLVRAEATRRNLLVSLGNHETELHAEIRDLVSRIGTEVLGPADLRERIVVLAGQVNHLHQMQPQLEVVETISGEIESSGAGHWAAKLRTIPAGGEDPLCPGDWPKRWRLRRLASWLDASQKLGQFRALQEDRQKSEGDLSRAYTRLIEQRTWLALKQQASPAVMSALGAYAVAVGRIGKGTGKSANRHRKTARQAANAVKGALPCWIMPHHRVSESLPPELGIFDLVIVDEASQSTLAALPALFRARQILVVGDDKQVSPDHVGLAMDQANARAARYLVSQVDLFVAPMREEASLYDLASVVFGGDNLMLREHFRCAAPIIEFSKRQFYRNELRPLRLSKASERLDPTLVDVRVTDGYRKGKTNPPEADFIVHELRRMGDDPAFEGRTFGVTTLLGTEQAALIYRRIENELGIPFIEKYHVRVGDPSTFQGDERDVMFLSMVVTPGNATALSGLGFEQRFNVAASRARERMILVRSLDLEHLSHKDALRRSLLEHFRSPFPVDAVDLGDARGRCESDFEREMFDQLANRGYSVDTQVKVGGHRIDMVVEGEDDRRLAIECDGDRYHGPEQWPADMARQRTLERAGWRIWRCFASRFVREREAVLDELTELLAALDIHPRKASERSRSYTELREWSSVEGDRQEDVRESEIGSDEGSGAAGLQPSAVDEMHFPEPDHSIDSGDLPTAPVAEPPAKIMPADSRSRVTEADVQAAILRLLGDGEVWANADLKKALSNILDLSPADRARSPSRPNEEKWEELVNNALTRSGRSNSLYAKRLVTKVGFGRHQLANFDPGVSRDEDHG